MKSDTLIRIEGMGALIDKLDIMDAERFIMLVKRDPFDYTRWQKTLYGEMSIEAICAEAVARRDRTEKPGNAPSASRKAAASEKPQARRKASKHPVA